ncbi:hypothetical protein B0E43_14845 [Algoriphagus sp. A40]|nr:hypothetical protein B0E43_14845 [Algoriphagus sp. A40]
MAIQARFLKTEGTEAVVHVHKSRNFPADLILFSNDQGWTLFQCTTIYFLWLSLIPTISLPEVKGHFSFFMEAMLPPWSFSIVGICSINRFFLKELSKHSALPMVRIMLLTDLVLRRGSNFSGNQISIFRLASR